MLADTIKEIRKKNYLSQAAFAKQIGVTQSAVSQWENDFTRPNSYQLEAIASTFNVSIDELLADNIKEKVPEAPKTAEAKILARGIDMLPEEQRKMALNVVKTIFANHPYFKEETADENDP